VTEVLTDEERTLAIPSLLDPEQNKKEPDAGRLAREFSNGVSQFVPFLGELRSIRLILRRIVEPLIELK